LSDLFTEAITKNTLVHNYLIYFAKLLWNKLCLHFINTFKSNATVVLLLFAPEYQKLVNDPADFSLVMVSDTNVVCKPSLGRKPETFSRPNTRDVGSNVKRFWVPEQLND